MSAPNELDAGLPDEFNAHRSGGGSKLWIALLLAGCAVIVGVIVACGSLIVPLINSLEERENRNYCRSNLREIGMALENYNTDYGCYPPAYLVGADGKPAHSWRALVLRYIDEELGEKYKFDEPWDSPHNQEIAAQMPDAYGCRSNPECALHCTAFVAIVGPGNFFEGSRPTLTTQVKDPANTIMVVEIAGHIPISWLEPRDIDVHELSSALGDRVSPSISSNHIRGAHVLMADGDVRYLPDSTPRSKIGEMLPIARGP